MQELIDQLVDKVGLDAEMARKVVDFLKEHSDQLPAWLGSGLEDLKDQLPGGLGKLF